MRVVIAEFDKYGRPLCTEHLCERHGRELAQRLKARWPEPHEFLARTRDHYGSTTVRVVKGDAVHCDDCNAPTVEQLLLAQRA